MHDASPSIAGVTTSSSMDINNINGDNGYWILILKIRVLCLCCSDWFAGYLHHILKKFAPFFCRTNLIKIWIKILEYPYSESLDKMGNGWTCNGKWLDMKWEMVGYKMGNGWI